MADPAPDDDDFELELEPVDPEVIAHQRQHVDRKTDEAIARVNVDELVRKPDHADYDVDWGKLHENVRGFRFTTRHLLIATAALAFALAVYQLLGGCMAIFVGALVALGAGWFGVYRVERREAVEREKARRKIEAALGRAKPTAENPWIEDDETAAANARPRSEFRFAFSLKQVFITMTMAAVVLGLLRFAGPQALIITLGALALAGIAVQTFGWFELPPAVIFCWWMMLVLYLVLGVLTAFFPQLLSIEPATVQSSAAISLVRDC